MIPDVDLDELESRARHIIKTCPFRAITEILNDHMQFLTAYRKLKKDNERLRAENARFRAALEWIVTGGNDDIPSFSIAKDALENKD